MFIMFINDTFYKPKYAHTFRLLLLAFCFGGCAVSQTFHTGLMNEPVVIPLRVDTAFHGLSKSGRAYLDVTIAGKTFPVFLDLGHFSTLSLTDSELASLPISFDEGNTSSSDAFGTTHHSRNYVIDRCWIGSLICTEMEATEFAKSPANPAEQTGGCLGIGFLKEFNIIFDYPNHRFVLMKDTLLPTEYLHRHWAYVPYYQSNGNCITTDATIHGKKLTLLWDTGASFSVIHPDIVGTSVADQSVVKLDSVNFAGKQFGPISFVTLSFPEPESDGLIGHNFFCDHTIFLNRVSHTLAIE
jgi:hypothetical protein